MRLYLTDVELKVVTAAKNIFARRRIKLYVQANQ